MNPFTAVLIEHSFLFLIAYKLLMTLIVTITSFWLLRREPEAWLVWATLRALQFIMAFVVTWNLAVLISGAFV